ncbi:MAG: Na/Pi cotransporter family protein [Clostridia bacterium]|nr:Na/Pi cotransporter family protein [Clostridia bacterium]
MEITHLISLLSGVALFLFGMTLMGDGLKKASGSKLAPILFRLSGTPLKGILLGTGVTAVIQSSSATSVMVVGFVNSGMMQVKQGISIILGAILGTSITGWVVCLGYIDGGSGWTGLLSTSTLSGIVAMVGILLRMFSKKQRARNIGDILLGFSVLMFGMSTMSGAVSVLGEQPWFSGLITSMTHPLLGILVGVVFSALLQSASAAVGIVQALSLTGMITLGTALPVLMGICIGASLPVLLSALGAEVNGKRTSVSYLVASFMGVMVCASIFYIADAIFRFTFLTKVMDPFSLALVNTVLRLAILCLLAPFADVLEALAALIVHAAPEEKNTLPHLEERFLAHPALAVEQSRHAINNMARESEEAIHTAMALLNNYSEAGIQKVSDLETEGDRYEDVLGSYLVKLTGQELTDGQNKTASLFLHTLSDYERISDHALSIARNCQEISEKDFRFSGEAAHELSIICAAVTETLRLTVEAFVNEDLKLAERVEPLEEVIDDLADEMKLHHVNRLQNGQCTIVQGFAFNDLITNLERVSDHCSNIAVALIELYIGSFDTHEYLGQVKQKRSKNYELYFQDYKKKYGLDEHAALSE